MYCQGCGALNVEKARFCNMCGSAIAPPGAPGGPISSGTQGGIGEAEGASSRPPSGPPGPGNTKPLMGAPAASPSGELRPTRDPAKEAPAPTSGGTSAKRAEAGENGVWDAEQSAPRSPMGYMPSEGSMSNVSLTAIGVRSSGRTWVVLVGISLLLVLGGAGGMYLMMGGHAGEPETTDEIAEPETFGGGEMEIGTPLPTGVDAPEVDFVSGGVRLRPGSGDSQGKAPSGASTGQQKRNGASGGRSPSGAGASTKSTSSGSSGGGGQSSGSTTMGSAGSAGGSATSMTASAGSDTSMATSTTMSAGSGSASGPDDDVPEERDIALDMYVSRVRFLIRRYYAAQAQSCFDSATRNNPTLRGTVVVGFTIGAAGNITQSAARRNTTGDEALGRCLAVRVRAWRLPEPPDGSLELEMPFSN